MKRILGLILLAAPWACSSTTSSTGEGPAAAEPKEPSEQKFVVHEWGTFTSMQSSIGAVLEGLHHTDEQLPDFVYGRGTMAGSCGDCPKDLETPPEGITQKLETPVLYFYGEHVSEVRVTVGFPDGVVSQWFPAAQHFDPPLGSGTSAGGSMTWHAELVPGLAGFPAVDPDDVWAPSRRVASLPVRIGDEAEQFIFYRGLGAFDTPLRVMSDAAGMLTVVNDSPDEIPAAFLLHLHEPGGVVVPLGRIDAYGQKREIVIPFGGKEHLDAYVETASNTVQAALEADGLYTDEARAMVDTWSHSYFRTPGLRILYVVSRTWTERLLPLELSPTPDELVRTLVGRIEVLTPEGESAAVNAVAQHAQGTATPEQVVAKLGRFAEPKLRRARELISDPELRMACDALIAYAALQP